MAAYNAETTIEASINSVLSQTYPNWELIIFDDCSTDSTASIAEAFTIAEHKIRLFKGAKNSGVAMARNHAIEKAQGHWLAFLDSDDLWHEDKLEKQLRFADEAGATITYTGTAYINESNIRYNYVLPAEEMLSYKSLLRRNIMSCSSVMVRRSVMIPFPQGYMHEDYAVWLQLVKLAGHAYGINEPLLVYRMSGQSKSAGRIRSARMIYNAYRYVGFNKFIASFFTIRYALHSISKRTRVKLGTSYSQTD